jgi:hypothetical protein
MTTESTSSHDEEQDFTRDLTVSIDHDYITLFTYSKGRELDRETAGKNALRALAELYPYNFAAKPTYRAYQTDNGKKCY